MYQQPFHTGDLSNLRFLVTGGAGFIGSHLVEYLIQHRAGKVVVVDDLSTGLESNLKAFYGRAGFTFKKGDINDKTLMLSLCADTDFVLHQAAIGSVPRSLKDPLTTHQANATGFLNLLEACRATKIKRLVYASSSSVYGDHPGLPKVEQHIGNPKSPYAISKLIDEYYANLYRSLYGLNIVGLRYFNIFGPRQQPNGPYAAAIPLFILAALKSESPIVYGDGTQTRDFTFVSNAVQANIKALFSESGTGNMTYNIACGKQYSLNDVIERIGILTANEIKVYYTEPRLGDIQHSLADISLAQKELGYVADADIDQGLSLAIEWYRSQ